MRLVLLGDPDDARGFRLAGVEATVCRTRDDVERAVAALPEDGDRQIGVVLVSASVYQLAPSVMDALQDRPRWPILLVLPEQGNGERRVA
jgi:vacuolar-type H+-ATPase subunit F/Vma7